jgi:geranylgeranyl reductase family protein
VAKKVLIVGAGPAGSACAATLARRGHQVTVIDKATFPRDKCCGDGLTTNALRVLESLDFPLDSVEGLRVCHDIEVRSPAGRSISLALPDGQGVFAAIAPRQNLDHALLEHCRRAGATVHEGTAFIEVLENGAESCRVRIEGLGDLSFDHVVAADGMWSPVRKSLGLSSPGYLGEWHAFRQYLSNVTGSAKDTLHIWFDDDLLPGYAWSFPLPDGRVNFGFGMLREADTSMQFMKDTWRSMLARPHIASALGPDVIAEDRHTAWPIPARIDESVHSSGRVLFVGDAVCATDTLTGEGIGQALETGIAAAEAIDQGVTPASVRSAYSSVLHSMYLADHRMSKILGRMLASPRVARAVLRLVDQSAWTRRNFVRWMFEDEPRAAAFTPRRWHRGFLKRPGAYR